MISGIRRLLIWITGTRMKNRMYTEDFPGNHDFLRTEFSMDVLIYPAETDMQ